MYLCPASKNNAQTIGHAPTAASAAALDPCIVEDLSSEYRIPMQGEFHFDDSFCYALMFSYLGRARGLAVIIILQHAQCSSFLSRTTRL